MNPESRIFVAGHAGLAGSAIVRGLRKRGYSNIITRSRAELNLLDMVAVSAFFHEEKPEFVIDSAARVGGIKANMEHQAEFLYENLNIQNNLMWSAHVTNVRKFLFLGSSCVYPRECAQPMKEEYFLAGPFEPTNEGYAVAKTAGIKLCEYMQDQYSQTFISVMPCNLYGPGDHFSPEYSHVHAGLMRRIHEAKESGASSVTVWGTGNARREFMHTDDLADACIFLLDQYSDPHFLNVGPGTDVSIRELAEMLSRIIKYEGALVFDTTKPEGMSQKLLDVSRINALGWKATIGLEDGLSALYNWYRLNVLPSNN